MREFKIREYTLVDYGSVKECAEYISGHPGVYISLAAESLLSDDKAFVELASNPFCHFYADGEGAVLSVRHLHGEKISKIPGCELWLELLKVKKKPRVALLGATQEVIESVCRKLDSEFNLDIVYYSNGFIKDLDPVINDIVEVKPDLVFIAMGQPKQESIAIKISSLNPTSIILPVGGSFDVYVGKVERAPNVWVKLRLEWLYRLLKEPKRWRRQLAIPKLIYTLFFRKEKFK